jgi:hypothetical protein
MKKSLRVLIILASVGIISLVVRLDTSAINSIDGFCPRCAIEEGISDLFSLFTDDDPDPTPLHKTEGWLQGETSVSGLSQEQKELLLGVAPGVTEWEKQQAQIEAQTSSSQTFTFPAEID